MNSYFSAGDWGIIVLYLLGIIGLGVWFGKDQRNTRDYFFGSKNVPWWGIGLFIVGEATSGFAFTGVPGGGYGGDHAVLGADLRTCDRALIPAERCGRT